MCRPCSSVSSPVLTTAVMSPAWTTAVRPRSIRAAPTPPQGHHHRASLGAPTGPPVRRPLVPSPPSMSARIPTDRHDTVVSVLSEAAVVHADVEAYVEPAAPARTAATSPSPSGTAAADGVAG